MGVQLKVRGKFHVKLNMGERPIANKYREGKMQRTLKRELKVLEIVKREAIGVSEWFATTHSDQWSWYGVGSSSPLWLPACFCLALLGRSTLAQTESASARVRNKRIGVR